VLPYGDVPLTRAGGMRGRRKRRDTRRKRKQTVRERERERGPLSEQVQSQVARPRPHGMTGVGRRKCRIKVVNPCAFVSLFRRTLFRSVADYR